MTLSMIALIILNIISKVFGLLREIILSYTYGVSELTDIYVLALGLPATTFSIILTGLSSSYISVYNEIKSIHEKKITSLYTSKILIVSLVLGITLSFLGFIMAKPISNIFAKNMSISNKEILIRSIKIISISTSVSGISAIFTGYLNNHSKFYYAAIGGIISNILIIISIIVSNNAGFNYLIIGVTIGIMSQVLVLYIGSYKIGFRFVNGNYNLRNEVIKTLYLSIPIFMSVAVNDLNNFIDKYIASYFEPGSISLINFSTKIYLFFYAILIIPISTIIFPRLSRIFHEKNFQKLKYEMKNIIKFGYLLIIPSCILVYHYSFEIIMFIFNRGAFNTSDVFQVSMILKVYIVSLISLFILEISNKLLHAIQQTGSTLIVTCISVVLNVVFSFISSMRYGIVGIAYGTTISSIIAMIISMILSNHKTGINILNDTFIYFIKILVISLFTTLITDRLYIILNYNLYNNKVLLIILLFAPIYLILNIIFNRNFICEIFTDIKKLS